METLPGLNYLDARHNPMPDEFYDYRRIAEARGFLMVSATPLTRSSYHADSDFVQLRENREAKLNAAKQ